MTPPTVIDDDDIPCLCVGTIIWEQDGARLARIAGSSTCYELNESAAAILSSIDGRASVADIVSAQRSRFEDATDRIGSEVLAMLRDLIDLQLIALTQPDTGRCTLPLAAGLEAWMIDAVYRGSLRVEVGPRVIEIRTNHQPIAVAIGEALGGLYTASTPDEVLTLTAVEPGPTAHAGARPLAHLHLGLPPDEVSLARSTDPVALVPALMQALAGFRHDPEAEVRLRARAYVGHRQALLFERSFFRPWFPAIDRVAGRLGLRPSPAAPIVEMATGCLLVPEPLVGAPTDQGCAVRPGRYTIASIEVAGVRRRRAHVLTSGSPASLIEVDGGAMTESLMRQVARLLSGEASMSLVRRGFSPRHLEHLIQARVGETASRPAVRPSWSGTWAERLDGPGPIPVSLLSAATQAPPFRGGHVVVRTAGSLQAGRRSVHDRALAEPHEDRGHLPLACPWCLCAPRPGDLDITLDASPAQGYGESVSTGLTLAALEAAIVGGESVLDVGTGSGVLAIAAARLGASRVVAIDLHPNALEGARRNVRRAQLEGIIEVTRKPIERIRSSFDLVITNLTEPELAVIVGPLVARVRSGGRLVTGSVGAGPDTAKWPALLGLERSHEEGGWTVLTLRRDG